MFRPEIGITTFLNHTDYKPISCLFKFYRSDFVVQEILKNQQICEITDKPQIYVDPKKERERVKLPEKLTPEMEKQLEDFRLSKDEKLTFNVEEWTKDDRRIFHVYIRSLGGLDSSTNGNEINVSRLIRDRKRKMRSAEDKKFVHFTLSKMDHDTAYCINLLTRMLHKNASSLGFCGTKDRRAITSQRVSVYGTDPAHLYSLNQRLRGMMISNAVYEDKALALGMATGNRFSIVLREFKSTDSEEVTKKRIDEWVSDGFLNYYGDQRFGSWGYSTSDIGQKILQKDWKGVIECLLTPNQGYETNVNAALKKYQETKDAKQAYSMLQSGQRFTSNEGRILNALMKNSNDYKGALLCIPRPSRSLYVHAYQSLIFNKIASRRADKYGKNVIKGDLFMKNDEFVDSGTIDDVVLPLPCFPSRYPDNEIESWYIEILKADNISKEVFLELKGEFAIGETMRKFVERPRNASYKFVWYKEPDTTLQHFPPFSVAKAEEIFDTPADGLRKALTIQFDLASGIYATIALRELLRFDLGKTNQKGMSKELRAENEINDLI